MPNLIASMLPDGGKHVGIERVLLGWAEKTNFTARNVRRVTIVWRGQATIVHVRCAGMRHSRPI